MISRAQGARSGLATVWHKDMASRFAVCFPRVYAYTLAMSADQKSARDSAMAAFVDTFAVAPVSQQQFIVELFKHAHEVIKRGATARAARGAGTLSSREREIISLLFDARLSRDQIAEVLVIAEADVGAALLNGLRKLQAATAKVPGPAAAAWR